jgi:DNA polymerase-3 subunit epsilon
MQTRTLLLISSSIFALGLLALAISVVVASSFPNLDSAMTWLGGTGCFLIIAGVSALFHILYTHFTALDRLRDGVVMLLVESAGSLPPTDRAATDVQRLHDAIATLVSHRLARNDVPDQRLAAVLGSIAEAIVVTTAAGQVSLVNNAARALLGADRVAVGTSLYAALSRHAVEAATATSRAAGRPVEADLQTVDGEKVAAKVADLGTFGGAVITFPLASLESHAEFDHDLALHDAPPASAPVTMDTPLADLPVLVFDCETTGLDVKRDSIVSLGGVRMHGTRLYRGETIDRLVDPGCRIPPRSTDIHGISDAMVAEAGAFDTHWSPLASLMEGAVLVGHNIAFDIAQLRAATRRFAIEWSPPPSLDTLLLIAALEPSAPGFSLESIAERFDVSVHGRHTALGDSLVTAEIYARLVPRLAEKNILTLGQAIEFGQRAKAFVKRQRESGWFDDLTD